jgi:hypothetical protein
MSNKPSYTYSYRPIPDITVYELALLIPFLMSRCDWDHAYDQLGAAQRHIKRSEMKFATINPDGSVSEVNPSEV